MFAWATALLLVSAMRALPQEVVEPNAEALESEPENWSYSLSVYGFDPPEEGSYVSGILAVDRGALHLEARYQYEDLDTGSFFVGRNFAWDGEVGVALVPLAGVVFGRTEGIAPAVELDLTWKALEFYVEAEYVFDLEDSDDSFFYAWSELTLAPTEWLSFGLVAQRTRVFDQELELDRGLLLRLAHEAFSLDLYFFNIEQDDPYFGLSLGLGI